MTDRTPHLDLAAGQIRRESDPVLQLHAVHAWLFVRLLPDAVFPRRVLSAEAALSDSRGDCLHYAIIARALAIRCGVSAADIAVYRCTQNGADHAIAIHRPSGLVLDNAQQIARTAADRPEIALLFEVA